MNKREMNALLAEMQEATNREAEWPCRGRNAKGQPCVEQYHGKFDRHGRAVFYYGMDCKVAREKFCDPCLLHWLIAVSRNVVLGEIQRDAIMALAGPPRVPDLDVRRSEVDKVTSTEGE